MDDHNLLHKLIPLDAQRFLLLLFELLLWVLKVDLVLFLSHLDDLLLFKLSLLDLLAEVLIVPTLDLLSLFVLIVLVYQVPFFDLELLLFVL